MMHGETRLRNSSLFDLKCLVNDILNLTEGKWTSPSEDAKLLQSSDSVFRFLKKIWLAVSET